MKIKLTRQQMLAEHRERERHFRILHAIDDALIEQPVPALPVYLEVKIPFTKAVKQAFAREVYNLMHI